jgi:nucleoside 2-deoxyribosyltransferase
VRIYVASSWRNNYQAEVVASLRQAGHDVYDFKDSEGFHWSEVDPDWKQWPNDVYKYLIGLGHQCAIRGFNRDMEALKSSDVCIMVMPCGPSASMEMGYAVGSGKPTAVYCPEIREPDLMVKMAQLITDDWGEIADWLVGIKRSTGTKAGHQKSGSL